VIPRPGARHICYCHTPMRFAWRTDDYIKREGLGRLQRGVLPLLLTYVRLWDVATTPRVDQFIANSREVAARIARYYGRTALVIAPPVTLSLYRPWVPGNFYLAGGRLIPYKRLDLVIRAFTALGLPLKVFGDGRDRARLQALAGPNVEFLGQISEEQRRDVHEDIRAEADRLYRLVENLLVLSRVERQGLQVESEPVLLQRLLPRVAEGEAARWPKVRFELDLPAGLPPVAAEETYLEQVLRNLLANAAKYGGEGRVDVKAVAPDGVVRVTVSDSGTGFEEAEGPRLFEIFYRSPSASRRASGAGIGLFVSQQLVRAMDGHMWAANRPEGGAEFGLELPVFGE